MVRTYGCFMCQSHACENAVYPKKLRVKGGISLRLKGKIPHAFERPVDPKKLRVEGGRMNHALERPIDH